MRTTITLLTVAAAALAAAACGQDGLMNPSAPDADVVATVDLEDGGAATLLDMGDGQMAMAVISSLADPGLDPYECDSYGVDWYWDWKDTFAGITKYRETTYRHNQPGSYTFYPGAPVYNGTNTNSLTYLGACNGDDRDDLVMEVHRRLSTGQWKRVLTAVIPSAYKFTFYSGVPSAYRAKVYGQDGSTIEHYGVGAAWTLSPPVATP